MRLFKILFCNLVYYYRHSRFCRFKDIPILATLVTIWFCLLFLMTGTVMIIDAVFLIKLKNTLLEILVSFIATIYLYYRICCGKRYIGIMRDPRYCYTKKRRIFSLLFQFGCLLYMAFAFYMGWLCNNTWGKGI